MPGPTPNREADLARPRARKGGDQQEVTRGVARPVAIPAPDPLWHPIATMIWDSATKSGQADFYQQSDWAMLWSLCEETSIYKTARVNRETGEEYHKRSPEMLKALLSGMASLLMTEGDRRRVRVELDAPPQEKTPAAVIAIAGYRQDLNLDA